MSPEKSQASILSLLEIAQLVNTTQHGAWHNLQGARDRSKFPFCLKIKPELCKEITLAYSAIDSLRNGSTHFDSPEVIARTCGSGLDPCCMESFDEFYKPLCSHCVPVLRRRLGSNHRLCQKGQLKRRSDSDRDPGGRLTGLQKTTFLHASPCAIAVRQKGNDS